MALRACRRCAQQKRRCDHGVPTCHLCKQAGEICAYPKSTRKHGPTAGMPEKYTGRIRELEAALDFLLSIPDVRNSLNSIVRVQGSGYTWTGGRGSESSVASSTDAISTLGDLIEYAEKRSSDQPPNEGQARQGTAWSSAPSPAWQSHSLGHGRSDTAVSEGSAQAYGGLGHITPAHRDLENFPSIASEPRFDFSVPIIPASFDALLVSGQADSSSNLLHERSARWSPEPKEAERDRADELYW